MKQLKIKEPKQVQKKTSKSQGFQEKKEEQRKATNK